MERTKVYDLINGERNYQEQAWGTSDELSVGEEILLLDEYVGRAASAWVLESAPEFEALVVVRKIAAIAVRCLENHGCPARQS